MKIKKANPSSNGASNSYTSALGKREDSLIVLPPQEETDNVAAIVSHVLKETKERAVTNADHKLKCKNVYWENKIKTDKAVAADMEEKSKSLTGTGSHPAAATYLWIAGLLVAFISGGSWVRWIALNTNDLLLAGFLAPLVPVTATGLHFWVWRSRDGARDRAIQVVIAGLALSGIALLLAVAQRFGLDAPIPTDMAGFLSGDDNRIVMITADLVGVCGSVLLMAWADELRKTFADRLRDLHLRIAADIAALETHKANVESRRQRAANAVVRKLLKTLSRF